MRKRVAISVFVLAPLVFGAVSVAALWGREQGTDTTAAVLREDFQVVVEAPGTIEAAVAFEIGPPSIRDVWEYNLSWMIPEGTFVKQGAVVARFDATEIEEQLREHRARLETVLQQKEKEQRNLEVSLRQLELDLVRAEGELKTVDLDLSLPEGLVAWIELEQARLQKDLAHRRVDFLGKKIGFEKELVDSKLELLDVKRAYEEGKIAYLESAKERFDVKAPVAGLVVYVPKRNGDRWEVGEGVWMMAKILKVADVATLQVEAAVLEIDAPRLAAGQSAEVAVDAVPGLVLQTAVGTIGRIVHERSLQDPSKVFDAVLPLERVEAADALRPGMGVQVRVRTGVVPGSLTVPLEAVQASGAGPFVEVVRSTGTVERRPVELGERNGQRIVVVSGVEEGEAVRLPEARA